MIVNRLAHRSPIQFSCSQLAQRKLVDPRPPPITGKKADVLHQHSRLLTRNFERPAKRVDNGAHPFERPGHRGIVEQLGRLDIHDHRAAVGEQQIVRNVTTYLSTDWRLHHERLRHNVIHRRIEVRHQQPRQFET
jgi:hypothetical protein